MADDFVLPDNFVPLTQEQVKAALAPGRDGKVPPADLAAMLAIKQPVVPPATAGDARARLAKLADDRDWGARFLAGEKQARAEYAELLKKAGEADAGPTNPVDAPFQTTVDSAVPARHVAEWASSMRELGFDQDAIGQMLQGKFSPDKLETARQYKRLFMNNKDFVKAFLEGDLVARREMTAVNAVLASARD